MQDNQVLSKVANTIRVLSAEAIEKANSGHPGLPLGMAEVASHLWLNQMKYTPKHPEWIGRDRFVLSAGHGSMLLYSALHLSGYDISIEDLKNFRQLGSKTAGHPESFITEGVECTTGPLGQGISNAVGMAIGGKILAHRFPNFSSLLNNQVYCLCGDGCLMEGISYEACSLAGHLELNNLTLIYDDNDISIAGNTNLTFSEDVAGRFKSMGWDVFECNAHNLEEVKEVFNATKNSKAPQIIIARSIIGKGCPEKENSASAHGSPLGSEAFESFLKHIDWQEKESFIVPSDVTEVFNKKREELNQAYDQWQTEFESIKTDHPQEAKQLEDFILGKIPSEEVIYEELSKEVESPQATRKLSSSAIQKLAKLIPGLLSGSADLEPSTLTPIKGSEPIDADDFEGRNIHFGIREHAMGGICNGLSHFGGFTPLLSTFLCFCDYMKPAIRLAALSELNSIYVFTHDSIFLGEDGPTHQPVEHLASLRAIPNLKVYRPYSPKEVAYSYAEAANSKKGPSAIILSRQTINFDPKAEESLSLQTLKQGAYILKDAKQPKYVIAASGSEVPLALEVASELEDTRVISCPRLDALFEISCEEKEKLFPTDAKTIVIEAGSKLGWLEAIETSPKTTLFITQDGFGSSAPAKDLSKKFGFTKESILDKIRAMN